MRETLANVGLLWLRALTGAGLMIHGWFNLTGGVDVWASKAVEPLGFPMPLLLAWIVIAAEVIGGFFFILGLWTRIAAVPVMFAMAVAAFGRHAADPIVAAEKSSKELALLYLVAAGAVLLVGPGRFSVDASRGGGAKSPAKKAKR